MCLSIYFSCRCCIAIYLLYETHKNYLINKLSSKSKNYNYIFLQPKNKIIKKNFFTRVVVFLSSNYKYINLIYKE